MLKITVHSVSVPDDIHRAVKAFFEILFDADQIEQVRVLELNHNINIAMFFKRITGSGPENPYGANSIFSLIFLFKEMQNLNNICFLHFIIICYD